MKFIILFIIFSFSVLAEDQTHFVFMNGGRNRNMNFRTYYNEIRYGYEITKQKGFHNHVITADGTWENHKKRAAEEFSTFSLSDEARKNQSENYVSNYPPINSGLSSKEDLKKHFKNMNFEDSNQMALVINGHGDFGETNDVGEQLVDLWGVSLTWKELGEILKHNIPQNVNIKITTNICNGGGVHKIAQDLPNVCASSAVPSFVPSSSGVNSMSLFTEGFFDHIRRNSNASLASASFSAFEADYANRGMGSLSSFDYIDSVLGTGQYDKSNHYETNLGFDSGYDFMSRYGEMIQYLESPDVYETTFSLQPQGNIDCIDCHTNNLENIYGNNFQQTEEMLNEIKGVAQIPHSNIFTGAINDLKSNKNRYLRDLRRAKSSLVSIKNEYERIRRLSSEANSLQRWWHGYEAKLRDLQKEYDKAKEGMLLRLQPLLYNMQIIQSTRKVHRFLRTASNEEKQKLIKLWECEWQEF